MRLSTTTASAVSFEHGLGDCLAEFLLVAEALSMPGMRRARSDRARRIDCVEFARLRGRRHVGVEHGAVERRGSVRAPARAYDKVDLHMAARHIRF